MSSHLLKSFAKFLILSSNSFDDSVWDDFFEFKPPLEFVDFYLRLLPYILAPRTMQKIDVSELSKEEISDMVKDIVDGD